jgi:hypothetical protein
MPTSVLDAVNAAIMGDRDGFAQGFQSAIAGKVSDALEIKKIEVASMLLSPTEVETNELENIETEVDGSDVASKTGDVGSEA